MTVYDRIKQLRIARGMSQEELAKKVGYEGRSAISKVENGDRDISQSMIAKYADALDVTPEYLLFGDKNTTVVANDGESEIVKLFQKLSPAEQEIILSSIKGILSNRQ